MTGGSALAPRRPNAPLPRPALPCRTVGLGIPHSARVFGIGDNPKAQKVNFIFDCPVEFASDPSQTPFCLCPAPFIRNSTVSVVTNKIIFFDICNNSNRFQINDENKSCYSPFEFENLITTFRESNNAAWKYQAILSMPWSGIGGEKRPHLSLMRNQPGGK